ncbi:MAG: squalene/phytoene synthase family protein [Marinicaulis sp.]|nr:squalene/phytoene synthase family protein [Marinicaulis sp.]NNL88123.1 squalene/phytoene synthase family protein [Marinicaulis sp.]
MTSPSSDYCENLVRAGDEDRWLASQYAGESNRRGLIALRAFQLEVARIPQSVSEPPLGEIRLQWWRDAFAEIRSGDTPRAHPVIEEFAATGIADERFEKSISAILDAGAQPLYRGKFQSVDELAKWLADMPAAFDVLAVLYLGAEDCHIDAVRKGSIAYALARDSMITAPNLSEAAQKKALDAWSKAKARIKKLPAEIAPGYLHTALTPKYVAKGLHPFPIQKRLTLLRAMALGV